MEFTLRSNLSRSPLSFSDIENVVIFSIIAYLVIIFIYSGNPVAGYEAHKSHASLFVIVWHHTIFKVLNYAQWRLDMLTPTVWYHKTFGSHKLPPCLDIAMFNWSIWRVQHWRATLEMYVTRDSQSSLTAYGSAFGFQRRFGGEAGRGGFVQGVDLWNS